MLSKIVGGNGEPFLIFVSSVAFGALAWAFVCRHYVWPTIRRAGLVEAARPLLILHLFRFVGASFLVPGVAGNALPRSFAAPGAYGDLTAMVLAWIALGLLRRPSGVAALWVFNVWGTADLLYAFFNGAVGPDFQPSFLGATFYIPTVFVPLLLCTHVMMFMLLLRRSSAMDGSMTFGPGRSKETGRPTGPFASGRKR